MPFAYSNSRHTWRRYSVPLIAGQPLRDGCGLAQPAGCPAQGQGVTTRAASGLSAGEVLPSRSRFVPSLIGTGANSRGLPSPSSPPSWSSRSRSSASDGLGVFSPTATCRPHLRRFRVGRRRGYVMSSGPGCSLTFHPSAPCSAAGCTQPVVPAPSPSKSLGLVGSVVKACR